MEKAPMGKLPVIETHIYRTPPAGNFNQDTYSFGALNVTEGEARVLRLTAEQLQQMRSNPDKAPSNPLTTVSQNARAAETNFRKEASKFSRSAQAEFEAEMSRLRALDEQLDAMPSYGPEANEAIMGARKSIAEQRVRAIRKRADAADNVIASEPEKLTGDAARFAGLDLGDDDV